MTDRQFVIRACQLKGIALIPPSKGSHGILGTIWSNGVGRHVIDATTWAEARKQLQHGQQVGVR